MTKEKDWKFIATVVVTVVVGLIPFYLYWADQAGKSIAVRVISRASLQPQAQDLPVHVEVAGTPVKEPFLSALDVSNTGDKFIPTKDFESPLQIKVESPVTILRARVTKSSPENVKAEVTFDKSELRLQPTLLNPKDTVTIQVLSAEGLPTFTASARIAGIPSVQLSGPIDEERSQRVFASILLVGAFISAIPVAGILHLSSWGKGDIVIFRKSLSAPNSLILLWGYSVQGFVALQFFKLTSLLWLLAMAIGLLILAMPVARWVGYRRNTEVA